MLKIYNTLTRKQEEFKPLKKDSVSFYQCGPTVYWVQHIGNMRAMVLADLIRRSLSYLDYKVKFARNYTDVGHLTSDEDEGEDKMAKAAKRDQLSPEEIAQKYITQFENDVKALNCLEPNYKPHATEYIDQMAKIVQALLDKGYAYTTKRAIYFDISKVENYTKLSGQDLEKNIDWAGKGEVGDGGKKNNHDFALWFFKTGMHQNDLQTWSVKFKGIDQPVESGSPGWHLECSAMNYALFGPTIDLHLGGIEHIPVHHTNEIAQSEAYTGQEFVRYWLHNEHLTVDGKKMSKSDGTAYSIEDIIKEDSIKKGYDPLVLRYFFLGAHYRSKQNFTWEALEGAKSGLESIKSKLFELKSVIDVNPKKNFFHLGFRSGRINEEFKNKFKEALEDDFNIPKALSVVFDVFKSNLTDSEKYFTITDFDNVLGILPIGTILGDVDIPKEIQLLAEARWQARINKDWQESDRLRDELAAVGWQMEDGKDDYKLKKL